jgi:hypothetical protein
MEANILSLGMSKAAHYHIRWSNGTLDWQSFETRKQAELRAKELALDGETYSIELLGRDCMACAALESPRTKSARLRE